MAEEKRLPQVPPPQTRIVDDGGRMTREFYDFMLKLVAKLEAENAALRAKTGL